MFNYNDPGSMAKATKKLMTQDGMYNGDVNSPDWGPDEEMAWSSYTSKHGLKETTFPDYSQLDKDTQDKINEVGGDIESPEPGYTKDKNYEDMYAPQSPDNQDKKSNPDEVNWGVMQGSAKAYSDPVTDNDDANAEGAKDHAQGTRTLVRSGEVVQVADNPPNKLPDDEIFHPPGWGSSTYNPEAPEVKAAIEENDKRVAERNAAREEETKKALAAKSDEDRKKEEEAKQQQQKTAEATQTATANAPQGSNAANPPKDNQQQANKKNEAPKDDKLKVR